MIESEKKEESKITINKATIYTVPYSSKKLNSNLNINTKTTLKTFDSLGNIINQALSLHAKGNILEASKWYQYLIKKGINDQRIFSNYGIILKDSNKFKEAILLTQKAIDLNPDYANAHANMGLILSDMQKYKEAEIATRKAIQLNPNFSEAYSNLGNILGELDKLKEAEIATRKAIQINPNFANAHSNLGNILSKLDKLNEAELSTRKAIEINPNFANAYSNLGNILSKLGKLKEAEFSVKKAIEINPNFANAYSNLGNILSKLGKPKEAENSYRKAIEIKPDFASAYSNMGIILSDVGRFKEAELSTRKAIEINPNYAEAFYNLANILNDVGRLREAETYHCRAIEIQPDFSEAYSNLGNILRDLGKLIEAEKATRKVIELNPNRAEAYSNHGTILIDLGKTKEGFDYYLKAIEIAPGYSNFYPVITRFLKDYNLANLNKSTLENILNFLLGKNTVPHKQLFKAFNLLYIDKLKIYLDKLTYDFSKIELFANDKLLLKALEKIIFLSTDLEMILTKLREKLSIEIFKTTFSTSNLDIVIALAKQCFLNEYIYSYTESEIITIKKILKKCIDGELNETNIAILACYFPLYKLIDRIISLESFNSSNQNFNELLNLQIYEPLKEIELSQKIKKIGLIKDNISQRVKSQYEENPYPRWRYGYSSSKQKVSIAKAINNAIKPNCINQSFDNREVSVLVAGCGTGQHILHTQTYKNAQITGIDLSLSSLSYAQRKINELCIDNVELIQMDILELHLLQKRFDIIECGGVLHHMDNPLKGLKELLDILKPTGFLKLGLYSELARQDIVIARNYIENKNFKANEKSIRDFRQEIISNSLSELNSLKEFSDFYSLSEFRDLCFHIKEHRFTIRKLQEIITSNNLIFQGFTLPQSIKNQYKKYFPDDKKQINLQNWELFEEKHSNTFNAMYQFWVSKKND